MRAIAWSAVVLMSCAGASGSVAAAALNTPIALGAAATSRAQGGCYAVCTPGTACNGTTGMCDALPCRGECDATQHCDTSGLFERCVPKPALLIIEPVPPP